MSWHVTGSVNLLEDTSDLRRMRDEALAQNPADETGRQFDAAAAAVLSLLGTGALGPLSRSYHVTLSGHANPGSSPPNPGVSPDTVTISVSAPPAADT